MLIPGDIGITPLVGMAQVLSRARRRLCLLDAARQRSHMPFLEELRVLLGERLEIYADEEDMGIDLAGEIARLHPEGEMYVRGPVQMMEAAQELWRCFGRPPTFLRFETYGLSGHSKLQPSTVTVQDHSRAIKVEREGTLLKRCSRRGSMSPMTTCAASAVCARSPCSATRGRSTFATFS